MNFELPELGEGVYEAEVVRWLVKPGDLVKRGQGLLEVLTDKATMEVPAPFAGAIEALKAEPGQQVKIGDVMLTYADKTAAADGAQPAPAKPRDKPAEPPGKKPLSNGPAPTPEHVKAAPSIRQLARKLGIDLAQVMGSGPQGRIIVEDLTQAIPHEATPPRPTPAPKIDRGTPGTRQKLQGVRRKIAEHMVEAKRTIPHYTYVDECDVTDLVKVRESLRDALGPKGIKITFLAFFVKAVVAALKEVPIVNSTFDEEAGEIVLHDQYHIGIAVATPAGLIVPVVHHADKLSLPDLARTMDRLGSEARAGKSRLEDLRGGTFTITSIGSLGGLFATPIIHHPQTAILGIGKVVKRPVFDEHDRVRPAQMVYLSLTCDHRVLDGAVATEFGNALIRNLQNPATLLIQE